MNAPINVQAKAPPVSAKELQGQVIRVIVYVMLLLSAGAAVLFGDRLWLAWRSGVLPIWAPLLAPAAFTAFVVVYTVDRALMVRRGKYPLSRALFQVASALVFLTLLLPQQASELRQAKHAEAIVQQPALWLLAHSDAHVREATCEVLIGRMAGDVIERVATLAHNDPELKVRTNCELALERLHTDIED
jgi:hypothetical protein